MLSTDAETPVVTKTAVGTDLLKTLKVVTELRVDAVGKDLGALAVDNVPLPVQEPRGDLELRRVLHDGHDPLELVRVELAGALREVDVGLFADNVGVPPANTLDLRQRVHDLALAVDISVEQTQNVLSNYQYPALLQIYGGNAPGTAGAPRGQRETWWAEGRNGN